MGRSIRQQQPQNARLYVYRNGFAAQSRTGGAKRAVRISRSVSAPRAGSPVSLLTTRVEVTTPRASTEASTTTSPCAAPSGNDGLGVVTKRISASGGQPPRRGRAGAAADAESRATSDFAIQPVS